MNKICVVIIAKDEAIRIAGAVASAVDFVDEVLVVDSGRSDDTVEISVADRARVVENVWPGFAEQRNFAAAAAKSDLVFILDAGEVFDADLAAFGVKFVSGSVNDSFAFTRIGDFLGRWPSGQDRVKHIYQISGSGTNIGSLRCIRQSIASEEMQSGKDFGLHYGFRGISDYVRQLSRFADLGVMQRYADVQKFGRANFIFWPPVKFVYYKPMRRLWQQGGVGFFFDQRWIYYELTIQMILFELQTLKTRTGPAEGDAF